MKFDILETNANYTICTIDTYFSYYPKFGMVELALVLKDLIIARYKDVAFLEWLFNFYHTLLSPICGLMSN